MLKVSGLCVPCRVLRSTSRKIFGRRLSHFAPFDCIGKCSPAVRRSLSPLSLWRLLLCSSPSLPSTAKTDRRKTERRARGTLCFTFKSLHYA